ncbi:hypothetical protein J2X46_000880 [Nocardioides sp. BE266]|uniref:hypothetical protein n=1 Tax=Nocardioides sp. BE266 TaxID=2817725 RepID=UPI002861B440|nr:hypothetical protein [Nocardioides sp. BE266]MDR7251904.1 hypothetical protein [Nocardioides sp. BE266]
MDVAALGNLLSGLVGAVIGALVGAKAATVVATRQIEASKGLQRRDELHALIAQFWGGCDALWVAQQDLGLTNLELMVSRQTGNGNGRQDLFDRRGRAFEGIEAALKECRRALALIRLLHPALAPSAEALMNASRTYHPRPSDEDIQAKFQAPRAAALNAFEEAAQAQLVSPAMTAAS